MYAAWVEPVAEQLKENRAQVLEFARSLPPEAWGRPTSNDGWSCKDVLAHIGGGNDRMFQTILRSVIEREPLDPSILTIDTDTENARGVEERRGRTPDELIAELDEAGEEIQELLSGLTDVHKELRQDGFPMSLGEFLQLVQTESHDLEHLAQIRAALSMDQDRRDRPLPARPEGGGLSGPARRQAGAEA